VGRRKHFVLLKRQEIGGEIRWSFIVWLLASMRSATTAPSLNTTRANRETPDMIRIGVSKMAWEECEAIHAALVLARELRWKKRRGSKK
jgi:hypothetical protein